MNEALSDDIDAEAEEVLNELNLITESEDAQNELRSQNDPNNWGMYNMFFIYRYRVPYWHCIVIILFLIHNYN